MTQSTDNTACDKTRQNLTPKQRKALYLFVEGATLSAIAKRLNVSRQTVSRWRHMPAFTAAYDEAAAQMQRQLRHHSTRLAELALQTLQLGMQEGRLSLHELLSVLNRVYPASSAISGDASSK